MKTVLFIAFYLTLCSVAPNLSELREKYPLANDSKEVTNQLNETLASVSSDDDVIFAAYKGAVLTLKAKYAKGVKNKKKYFKEGVALLEQAIKDEPENIEIRCLRLGVQENAPKIVRYKKNIQEDKQFILDHYKKTSSKAIREFVKNYVMQSAAFDSSEKQLF